MRTIKAVVLVCISTTLLIVAQSSDPTLEKELLAVLHPMYAAEQRHDLAYVKSHLDEDFAEVAGDGNVYGFNDIEKDFAEMQLIHYALTNCIARAMGVNAAYLTGRMEVEASYQGTPLPKEMRVTWLWKKSASGFFRESVFAMKRNVWRAMIEVGFISRRTLPAVADCACA